MTEEELLNVLEVQTNSLTLSEPVVSKGDGIIK
jgi:hypothetical protein